MTANAQYAADAARTAARLIASGDMNPDPTCAEAAGVATRMQPEAAAVARSLASQPASPEYKSAVDWNNELLDLILWASAQSADAPLLADSWSSQRPKARRDRLNPLCLEVTAELDQEHGVETGASLTTQLAGKEGRRMGSTRKPLPLSRSGLWERYVRQLEELEAEYGDFETDAAAVAERPLLADIREPVTAEFHVAFKRAQDLRRELKPRTVSEAKVLGAAVRLAWASWHVADRHARTHADPRLAGS